MSVTLSDLGSGLEIVQTAMYLQLSDRLEQNIARQQVIWDEYDAFLAERAGAIYRQTVIEHVDADSLITGARGSLLKMPADFFPAVAVMCDRVGPTPEAFQKSSSPFSYASQVYVEVVVRSDAFDPSQPREEFEQEGVVDRRCKRTAQAVIDTIMGDPSLGAVTPALSPPRAQQTDPFSVQGTQPDDMGRIRIFSLSRIDFVGELYAEFDEATSIASIPLSRGFGA